MSEASLFRVFAEVADTIRGHRSTHAKVATAATYLRALTDEALVLASRYLSEGAFPQRGARRIALGGATIGQAAAIYCDLDYDVVFKACRYAAGSTSEAVAALLGNVEAARARTVPAGLTLLDVHRLYEDLADARRREEKIALLHRAWSQMTPLEAKHFLRIAGRGSLRIGFTTRSVLHALAAAFEAPLADIRLAHQLTASVERTARLAAAGRLSEAAFALFSPLQFMLASSYETRRPDDVGAYVAEEKLDGMRCQAHVDGERVRLFSRDLNDITRSYPDVVAALARTGWEEVVIDGEIIIFEDVIIQPFQRLQQRMQVQRPSEALQAAHPARLVAFDVLIAGGTALFDAPMEARRLRLAALAEEGQIAMTRQHDVMDPAAVAALYAEARRHGNEGLVLKRRGSAYEYGQRGGAWLKVKEPGGDLDTVLLYAHRGSGKRGGTYSDFTLGVRVDDDERYEESFIPIGKAYGGYTDEELRRLNEAVRRLQEARYGPTLQVRPELVVTLEFDEIQVNRRTKAGFTLRLPRFKAIRWDLAVADVDTLRDVEALYEAQVGLPRERQAGVAFSLHRPDDATP